MADSVEKLGENRRLWRVTRQVLSTPLLAVGLLVTTVSPLELVARSGVAAGWLPPPSYDTPSRVFDVQMQRLYRRHADRGVDCVFLGSSPVQDGIDPAAFSSEIARRSEARPECFNLAVPGMRAASTGMLGRVVFEDLTPWLVVYGFSPRDFVHSVRAPALDQSEWLRYRTGGWSLRGWAIDGSLLYRMFLGARTASQRDQGWTWTEAQILREDGLLMRFGRVADPVAQVEQARATTMGHDGHDPNALVQLRLLLENPGVRGRVVIVRMPTHPAANDWMKGTESYAEASRIVATLAEAWKVPLLVPSNSVVGTDGWVDVAHANVEGAVALGHWLGARVSDLVDQGQLPAYAAD